MFFVLQSRREQHKLLSTFNENIISSKAERFLFILIFITFDWACEVT